MAGSLLFFHGISFVLMYVLIIILSDWSCIPKERKTRQDRGMIIVAVVVPIGMVLLAMNLLPYFNSIIETEMLHE